MDSLTLATDDADATAIDAIERHHAELAAALHGRVGALVDAAGGDDPIAVAHARERLTTWATAELVPHAEAEEETLYPAAHETVEGRLLVSAMVDEHATLVGLVRRVETEDGVGAAAAATALEVLFTSHVRKENLLLLPLLAQHPSVSLAALLDDMHHAVTATTPEPAPAPATAAAHGGGCGCHEVDDEVPELDARSIPHAIRHPMVFAALDEVPSGGAMVIVAPHDPLPLLDQIQARTPDRFTIEYLQRGPGAWRLRFTRTA